MSNEPTTTPQLAKLDDLSYDLAYQAYAWISMSPERRAKQEQQSYVDDVHQTYAMLSPFALTNEQKTILATEIERYRLGYLEKIRAVLGAKSRTASSMVTGPANFPTRTMEKRNQTVDNRTAEFLEWRQKAHEAIKRKLLDARTDDQKLAHAWSVLKNDIAGSLGTIYAIDYEGSYYTRSAFVNSIVGKVERLANNGEVELVERALHYVRSYNNANRKPAIADRHKFWTMLDVAKAARGTVEQTANQDEQIIVERNGIQVIDNPALDRIQIIFPGKPVESVRQALRSSGWNWSPSNSAWQRKRTEQARQSAQTIIDKI